MPEISAARRLQLSNVNTGAARFTIRCLICPWTDIASRRLAASAAAHGHIDREHTTPKEQR